MWEGLSGQDQAVAMLRRAAERPGHAYLLAGAPVAAARSFAAALLCSEGGCGECGVCDRVLRGRHPDVTEVEPEGSQIVVSQASAVIETAFRTPVEASRKVIVVHEAERMNETVQNKLLKTFEEPPADTVFLLLTGVPDELLPTVRSRCQVVTFPADVVGGPRAGYEELRRVWGAAPGHLDGTGSAAANGAGELLDAVEQAGAAVKETHDREREELAAELEQAGYSDRVAARLQKALAERQKRGESRARVDAIMEGLSVLEAAYRDALVGGSDDALAALDALAATRRAVAEGTVLNWGLQIEALLLRLPGLPGAGVAPDTLASRSSGPG